MSKNWNFLRLSALALMTITLFTFATCEDDDGEETTTVSKQEFAEKYFTVSGGTFHSENMPASTSSAQLSGVSFSTAEAGGTVTISSDVEYERFFIGVDGKSGYLEYVPRTRAAGYTYNIPLTIGNDFSETVNLAIKGQTAGGDITRAYLQPVSPTDFGIDLGAKDIKEVRGQWTCDYVNDEYDFEYEGTTYHVTEYNRCNVTFNTTTTKTCEFTMEEFSLDEKGGKWDGAWHWQVEGTARMTGSTLHLYYKKVRARSLDGDWSEWKDKGSVGNFSPYVNDWKRYANTWSEYVENYQGVIWECLVSDTKKNMQWRKITSASDSGNSYNYDSEYAIRNFTKK